MEFALDDVTLTQLQGAEIDVTVHVKAKMNVTPFIARQKVNVLLLDKVGTGLLSGSPILMAGNGRLLWRVPILLSLPKVGQLGEVGSIDVDVQTAEILVSDPELDTIRQNANQLAQRATV